MQMAFLNFAFVWLLKFRIIFLPVLTPACWSDLDRRERVHKRKEFPVKYRLYSQGAVSNVTL